jgi:hypothetical protein
VRQRQISMTSLNCFSSSKGCKCLLPQRSARKKRETPWIGPCQRQDVEHCALEVEMETKQRYMRCFLLQSSPLESAAFPVFLFWSGPKLGRDIDFKCFLNDFVPLSFFGHSAANSVRRRFCWLQVWRRSVPGAGGSSGAGRPAGGGS